MASITSVNAVITLAIPGVFEVPQQLQGFGTDNIYETETLEVVETQMGVDGHLSGGFVYNPVRQTFTLQADSASNALFEQWVASMRLAQDVYTANGSTTLKSTGVQYVSVNGFLRSYPTMPTANKYLQARKYVIEWQSVTPVPA